VSIVFSIFAQLVREKHFTVIGAYIAIVTGNIIVAIEIMFASSYTESNG